MMHLCSHSELIFLSFSIGIWTLVPREVPCGMSLRQILSSTVRHWKRETVQRSKNLDGLSYLLHTHTFTLRIKFQCSYLDTLFLKNSDTVFLWGIAREVPIFLEGFKIENNFFPVACLYIHTQWTVTIFQHEYADTFATQGVMRGVPSAGDRWRSAICSSRSCWIWRDTECLSSQNPKQWERGQPGFGTTRRPVNVA